jgi:hypothetical protein
MSGSISPLPYTPSWRGEGKILAYINFLTQCILMFLPIKCFCQPQRQFCAASHTGGGGGGAGGGGARRPPPPHGGEASQNCL